MFFGLIEELPLKLIRNMLFQIDGYPALYSKDLRSLMDRSTQREEVLWPGLHGLQILPQFTFIVDIRRLELMKGMLSAFNNVRRSVEEFGGGNQEYIKAL